jgi:hypothetical protein
MTGGLPPISSSWRQAPWDSRPPNLFSNRTLVVIVLMQHPLWREDGSLYYNWCWSSPEQSFSGPSPAGLMTAFYCLTFGTPLTWRTRSSYLHSPGTGWPSYTPRHWVPFSSPPPHGILPRTVNAKSKLLYDLQFTVNQFILALSPLRPTTRHFFQRNCYGNRPYVTSSLTRRWVCLLWIYSAFR